MGPQQDQQSHLFLVRFWSEEARNREGCEWSGRVQHVLSGEAYSFHDWPTLIDKMVDMATEEAEEIEIEAPESKSMEAS